MNLRRGPGPRPRSRAPRRPPASAAAAAAGRPTPRARCPPRAGPCVDPCVHHSCIHPCIRDPVIIQYTQRFRCKRNRNVRIHRRQCACCLLPCSVVLPCYLTPPLLRCLFLSHTHGVEVRERPAVEFVADLLLQLLRPALQRLQRRVHVAQRTDDVPQGAQHDVCECGETLLPLPVRPNDHSAKN